MLTESETGVLVVEVRNENEYEARFTALNYKQNKFLWKDVIFEEPWWIGLTALTPSVLLLHCYNTTDNPDKKNLVAWHIHQQKIIWKLIDFEFDFLESNIVFGYFTNAEDVKVKIDLFTGKVLENVSTQNSVAENIDIRKPFQYIEGTEHFNTVKNFLADTINVWPLGGVEYLEYAGLVFISYQVQEHNLVNYLLTIDDTGKKVMLEKLNDNVKGLGMETFFILSGCLFFVRNKCELVSYKIV